ELSRIHRGARDLELRPDRREHLRRLVQLGGGLVELTAGAKAIRPSACVARATPHAAFISGCIARARLACSRVTHPTWGKIGVAEEHEPTRLGLPQTDAAARCDGSLEEGYRLAG